MVGRAMHLWRCPPAHAIRATPPRPSAAASSSPSPRPGAATLRPQSAPFAGGAVRLGAQALHLQALSAEGGGAGGSLRRRQPAAAKRRAAGPARAAEGSPRKREGGSAARGGQWETRFAELEEYRARFGDCKVPRGWEESPKLCSWVNNQRTAYKKGALEASKQQRLEGLGLVWDTFAAEWEARFAELEEYRARFGDCKVPAKWEENPQLGEWVSTQRKAYKKGALEVSKRQRLEGLAFVWDLQAAEWEARYAELEEYRARFGDCKVPQGWEESPQLYAWVSKQRLAYKKGTLEASRQQRLEGLGLVWDPLAADWEARYAELEEYRARFGDCNVPKQWEESPQLGAWVDTQRTAYKKGTLEASKKQRLEGLGLVWDPLAAEWEAQYAELEEYRARFGDCKVPAKWEENPQLGEWVSTQRKAYKKGALEASRQQRLEGLGFVWEVVRGSADWEARYAELVGFWQDYGTCDVPQSFAGGGLARWVEGQRDAFRRGGLGAKEAARLQELGFQWVGSGEGATGGLLGAARWVSPGDEGKEEEEGEEEEVGGG